MKGGAASTTSGGTAGNGFVVTGGAGAGSTNGAAIGALFQGGGTNTVATTAANVGAYIRIDSDESINIYIGQSEMGQGISTGLAQIVADALMVDWSAVRVLHSPVDGSATDANFYNPAFADRRAHV